MTVSAAKPEEKRLGWFVPTAVDQAESCVKPAAEGRNLARMPNPQHSETERLDHGPNWLKHTEDGLLLGECRSKLNIVGIVPKGDKATRLMNVSPLIESGRVSVPKDAPWLAELRDELTLFPNGRHDDQVDSVSKFLGWLKQKPFRWNVGGKMIEG